MKPVEKGEKNEISGKGGKRIKPVEKGEKNEISRKGGKE